MKIVLTQNDIIQAIKNYVSSMIVQSEQNINIELLTNMRSSERVKAVITIDEQEKVEESPKEVATTVETEPEVKKSPSKLEDLVEDVPDEAVETVDNEKKQTTSLFA